MEEEARKVLKNNIAGIDGIYGATVQVDKYFCI